MLAHVTRRFSLLAAALMMAARAGVAQSPRLPVEQTVDKSVRPGDDFFAYANSSWLKATPIPNGKERVGAREQITEIVGPRVARLLDEPAFADFRAAYADASAIEAKGIVVLKPAFDRIDNIRDKTELARELGRGMRADVDPLNWGVYRSASLLGLSVEHSIHGEKTHAAFLVQGGLGLGDRQRYIDTSDHHALHLTYRAYIARQLSQAGFADADRRAANVFSLETSIARGQGSAESSANDRNADNVWTREDFAKRAPGMDWQAFFEAARLSNLSSFVVWQPSAATGLAALVESEPMDAWKDYLRFHEIDTHADVLPSAYFDAAVAMHGGPSSRSVRADEATKAAFSDEIGRMYAARYFPAAEKARVQKVVADVRAAFVRRIEASTWLSPASKAQAIMKAKTLYIGVGYPDRRPTVPGLTLNRSNALENQERVLERDYSQALARLNEPFDATVWLMAPHVPGGILIFQQNTYNVAAALLQAPKYDPGMSDAQVYGSIGAIIGHDITHYVDVLGADYDTTGAMKRWWTRDDSARFEAAAQPLVDQFSAYRPFSDVALNGRLSRTENVADLGGLVAAFDAYRMAMKPGTDTAARRRSDREFFIAFAQGARSKWTDEGLRKYIATSDHAPDMYRAATVRNLDAWYDAFDVRPGDKLYLPAGSRVRIW